MRIVSALLVVLAVLRLAGGADDAWQGTRTAADFVERYPERCKVLFAGLDLDRPGLAAVKDRQAAGDAVGACRALLAYYRDNGRMAAYRREAVPPSPRTEAVAERIIVDELDFPRSKDYPIGRRGTRLDWGDPGPIKNPQFTKRLHRQQYLSRLLAAHQGTGNPAYLAHLDRCLRDWLTRPDRGQFNGKINNNIDHGIRLQQWVPIFYGTLNEDGILPATRLLLLSDLDRHARFIIDDPGDPNLLNFSSITMNGLSALGAAWPELAIAERARGCSLERLRSDIKNFVYPDGVQKEMAPGYHRLSAQNFADILRWQRDGGFAVPDDLDGRIEEMFAYVAATMAPDGDNLCGGDAGETDLRERLLQLAETYDRDDWRAIASYGERGTLPPGTGSRLYPWAGTAIIRNGWGRDATYLSFDIGPLGSGHGDPDKLHLTLYVRGRPVLVDGGRFPYGGPVAREFRWTYGKHSRGHNVVLVDDHSQAWLDPERAAAGTIDEVSEPIAEEAFTLGDAFDAFRGSVSAWHRRDRGRLTKLAGKAIHDRGLVYVRDRFTVVVDHLRTDRPREIQALWHFHPDCTVITEGADSLTTDAGVGNLRIVPLAPWTWKQRLASGEKNPPQGWYCGNFATDGIRKSRTAVYGTRIEADATFAWILVHGEGAVPAATGALVAFADGAAVVDVAIGDDRWRVTVPVLAGRAAVAAGSG